MSIQFSPVIATQWHTPNRAHSVRHLDLRTLGELGSPIARLDHFRVRGPVAGAQRHAGFSVATYVLEDSSGHLRSRDSMGHDMTMRPGGIIWMQAGRGVTHDVLPAEDGKEIHGLQLLIELSARNRQVSPSMLPLEPGQMPEWRSSSGDRARIVVGSFAGLESPLTPADPFNLLDVRLRCAIHLDLQHKHNALVYALGGSALVVANGHSQRIEANQALALYNFGQRGLVQIVGAAHLLYFSGAAVREPVVRLGTIITALTRTNPGTSEPFDALLQA